MTTYEQDCMRDEVRTLREALNGAPHGWSCESQRLQSQGSAFGLCNCWKSRIPK